MLNWWHTRHNTIIFILGMIVLLLGRSSITTIPARGEDNWLSLVTEAKKEGAVVIYSSVGPEVRQTLGSFFKQKFGINVEWTMGRSGELAERILTEQRAWLYVPDVWLNGDLQRWEKLIYSTN